MANSNNDFMLTTVDNPYNPFTQYDEWRAFDEIEKGYYTNNYLARVAVVDSGMSDEAYDEVVSQAILHIVATDPTGLYTIVHKSSDE